MRVSRRGGEPTMLLVMCLSCGEFVPAKSTGDGREPLRDACPDCGGTKFKTVSE